MCNGAAKTAPTQLGNKQVLNMRSIDPFCNPRIPKLDHTHNGSLAEVRTLRLRNRALVGTNAR